MAMQQETYDDDSKGEEIEVDDKVRGVDDENDDNEEEGTTTSSVMMTIIATEQQQQEEEEDGKESSSTTSLLLSQSTTPNNSNKSNGKNHNTSNGSNIENVGETDITSTSFLVPVPSSSSSTRSSLSPAQQQRNQKQQRQQRTTTSSSSTSNKRHGARNQHRHKKFVKWIMETFPKQIELSSSCCDNKGDDGVIKDEEENENDNDNKEKSNNNNNNERYHILDVAGGKGEVSARLTMCCQQNVIMVDPRPANVVDCFESLVLPKIPNKWQKRIVTQIDDDPEFISKTINTRFQQLVTTFDSNLVLLLDDSNQQQKKQQELLLLHDAILNSSLILGLHADSATEAIVDIALKYNKPFVVVPCCVFPNFFKQRQIFDVVDGKKSKINVRTHDQFCQYLLNKSPKLTQTMLPFEGRNIAIWWDGK